MPAEHKYVEIVNDSRQGKVTVFKGMDSSLVLIINLDEEFLDASTSSFNAFDQSDDAVALEYAYTIFPDFRVMPDKNDMEIILTLKDIAFEQVGRVAWKFTGSYKYDISGGGGQGASGREDEVLENIKIGFSVGGGTRTITQSESRPSKDHPTVQVLPGAPEDNGAIGVTKDGITGAETASTEMRLQITGYFRPSYIDIAFIKNIRRCITGNKNKGTYNDDWFLGAEAGELSLMSATGGGTVVDTIPVTFEFSFAINIDAESDGVFPDLTMLGQDFVDYRYHPVVDDNTDKVLMTPSYRFVHRFKEAYDYELIGLPSEQTSTDGE